MLFYIDLDLFLLFDLHCLLCPIRRLFPRLLLLAFPLPFGPRHFCGLLLCLPSPLGSTPNSRVLLLEMVRLRIGIGGVSGVAVGVLQHSAMSLEAKAAVSISGLRFRGCWEEVYRYGAELLSPRHGKHWRSMRSQVQYYGTYIMIIVVGDVRARYHDGLKEAEESSHANNFDDRVHLLPSW